MKTTEKIVQLIKLNGAMTVKALANKLSLTTMGVRQHLQVLENEAELIFEDKKAPRGRPTRYWSLTSKTHSHFANGHEELTVQLIESVKTIFGDEGLNKLIEHREESSLELYQNLLTNHTNLFNKLNALAKIRSDEGYMATVEEDGNNYWLLENHCPICAAAAKCLSFCRSELTLFQVLLKNEALVSREEHIIEGARRCAYKIIPL